MEVSSFVKIIGTAFLEDLMSTTLNEVIPAVLSAKIIKELRDAEADKNLFKSEFALITLFIVFS